MIEVDQEQALEVIESGMNVFLTGEAGSGKTYTIKTFVKNTDKNVAITATTGIAALNIGGETIHRFLGLGILTRPEDAWRVINKWEARKKSGKPWDVAAWKMLKSLDTLIIDEVSMLRRDQLELIDAVLSNVLNRAEPFGGVQIVLVGDFFQLPPVVTDTDKSSFNDLKHPYCFQSDIWRLGKFAALSLNTNYRQSDPTFLKILNKIRTGDCDKDVDDLLNGRLNKKLNTNIQPVRIFSHKKDVEQENLASLKALNKPIYVSEAEYSGKQFEVDILKKESQASDKLYFCEGAQIVMLTNDKDSKWVNGTLGIIIDVDPLKIQLSNGTIVYPPFFTWERVVHKTKGAKLERQMVATMEQYPFNICYAQTVHKSQGLTLDYVELDLSSCFAPGQAYVALSRVKELDGLTLTAWDKKSIITDKIVKKFYKVK